MYGINMDCRISCFLRRKRKDILMRALLVCVISWIMMVCSEGWSSLSGVEGVVEYYVDLIYNSRVELLGTWSID